MTSLVEALNISSSPYVNAALSIVLFILLAKLADLFVDKVMRRFTRFTKSELDNRILDVIHRPIYFTISLVGVVLAVRYLQAEGRALYYSNGIVYTLLVLLWGITIIRVVHALIEGYVNRTTDVTGLKKNIVPLVTNVSKVAIFVAAVAVVFSIWQINITPLLASAGLVGAGVAIAAKDTISNLFGGISIFFDRPFKVGDYIILEGGERGEVVMIGLRSTRIMTRDHVQVILPNSVVANSKIINESVPEPNFRVRVPVTVAYGSDIDLVQKTLVALAEKNGNVVPEPSPRVRFRSFGDSALIFELLCWAKEPALRGLTIHELNCSVYHRFKELGIQIPFPQRDIHIISQDRGLE